MTTRGSGDPRGLFPSCAGTVLVRGGEKTHVFVFLLCKRSEYDSPETCGADVCGNEVSFLYSYFSECSHILKLLCMPEQQLW